MTWYKQLKFKVNPLDSRPNPNLIGLEDAEENLVNHILKGEICFLNGPTGSGKTSLLVRIQKKLKDHKFIYLDADDLPPDFNLEEELKNKRNFFDRLTFKEFPSKQPILMIDEFQATDPNLILKARSKWESTDKRIIRSIVIAQIDKYLHNASGSFKERLGKRMVSLDVLDSRGLKDMLKLRLYNKKTKTNLIDKFTEDALNLLVKCADNNPRRILEYTDMIFDFHYTKFKHLNPILKGKDYQISHFVIEDILRENGVIVEQFKKKDLRVKQLPVMERFTEEEHKLLSHIFSSDAMTSKEISKSLEMSPRRVTNLLRYLKKKEGIVVSGRKGRYKLFEVSPGVRRSMVKK